MTDYAVPDASPALRSIRHAAITPHARRLTPSEVAQHWFRRGRDFVPVIHSVYPNFPKPAPDGLYLLKQVEGWFDRLHGMEAGARSVTPAEENEEAMRAARGH
jgi:hypothetical protein